MDCALIRARWVSVRGISGDTNYRHRRYPGAGESDPGGDPGDQPLRLRARRLGYRLPVPYSLCGPAVCVPATLGRLGVVQAGEEDFLSQQLHGGGGGDGHEGSDNAQESAAEQGRHHGDSCGDLDCLADDFGHE